MKLVIYEETKPRHFGGEVAGHGEGEIVDNLWFTLLLTTMAGLPRRIVKVGHSYPTRIICHFANGLVNNFLVQKSGLS